MQAAVKRSRRSEKPSGRAVRPWNGCGADRPFELVIVVVQLAALGAVVVEDAGRCQQRLHGVVPAGFAGLYPGERRVAHDAEALCRGEAAGRVFAQRRQAIGAPAFLAAAGGGRDAEDQPSEPLEAGAEAGWAKRRTRRLNRLRPPRRDGSPRGA